MKFRFLWFLALIPLGLGLWRLRFDVDVLNLLPRELSSVQGLKLFQTHFSSANELIVTLEATDADAAENFARDLADRLRAATNLIRSVTWQPPWLEHPEQGAELAAYAWLNQTPESLSSLTNRLANPAAVLASTRERLSTSFSPEEMASLAFDPFSLTQLPEPSSGNALFDKGRDMFASGDGTFRLIFVKSSSSLGNYKDCSKWLEAVRSLTQDWRSQISQTGLVTVHFTGGPAFTAEIASGMERDISSSVIGTAFFIAILFWFAYRGLRALFWLLFSLGVALAGTLALGGLIVGTLNVVSLGFAAILLGLAVDYGLVIYQESLDHPDSTTSEVRRRVAPSIIWSAVTTAGAFLVLNFSGLPGLGQLGTLVAIGIALGAVVMIFAFLPLIRMSNEQRPTPLLESQLEKDPSRRNESSFLIGWLATGIFFILGIIALFKGLPPVDHTADPLRPLRSEAYSTAELVSRRLGQRDEPVWVIVSGRSESEIASRLAQIAPIMREAVSNRALSSAFLPDSIWPNPDYQRANLPLVRWLSDRREVFRAAALAEGFSTNALILTDRVLDVWAHASDSAKLLWPTNDLSRWIFEKFSARTPDGFVVAGMAYPSLDSKDAAGETLLNLSQRLLGNHAFLAGWQLLGEGLLKLVRRDLWWVLTPMVVLLLLSLWFAFRRVGELLLSLSALAMSATGLLVLMLALGWSWNLLNLMAIPLLLGSAVDYSIHMQMALRRHNGDISRARRTTGRALCICAATTVVGFGSLAWSRNAGLASLGLLCAAGIGVSFVVSFWLLPAWWTSVYAGRPASDAGPSSLYGGFLWKIATTLVRCLPRKFCRWVGRLGGLGYWLLRPQRRAIVVQNLLPVFDGDIAQATTCTTKLFKQFAEKLVDLWQYEGGACVLRWFDEWKGWEFFLEAQARGRGVLLVTMHLGNWELGAPFLTNKGVRFLALSQPEPDDHLTAVRQAARARRGVETLIVGNDPFVFVDVLKQLGAGTSVAMLVDRPASASSVDVQLFRRPFSASIAAAELARASGCAVLPVAILSVGQHYRAQLLPEIPYDRAALGTRENRRALTQEIVRAFEPIIRQHASQWYHFVPIWPRPI